VAHRIQNASGNWPDSSRPDVSVMVPEIITGLDVAFFGVSEIA